MWERKQLVVLWSYKVQGDYGVSLDQFENKFRVDHSAAYKHCVMLWRAKVQGFKAGEEVSLIWWFVLTNVPGFAYKSEYGKEES